MLDRSEEVTCGIGGGDRESAGAAPGGRGKALNGVERSTGSSGSLGKLLLVGEEMPLSPGLLTSEEVVGRSSRPDSSTKAGGWPVTSPPARFGAGAGAAVSYDWFEVISEGAPLEPVYGWERVGGNVWSTTTPSSTLLSTTGALGRVNRCWVSGAEGGVRSAEPEEGVLRCLKRERRDGILVNSVSNQLSKGEFRMDIVWVGHVRAPHTPTL